MRYFQAKLVANQNADLKVKVPSSEADGRDWRAVV